MNNSVQNCTNFAVFQLVNLYNLNFFLLKSQMFVLKKVFFFLGFQISDLLFAGLYLFFFIHPRREMNCLVPPLLPPAALQALKRKKRYEKQLAQIDGTLSTIEFQREALENANTNTEVLKNMGFAAKAMKAAHENM